jgi:hypothetical protein
MFDIYKSQQAKRADLPSIDDTQPLVMDPSEVSGNVHSPTDPSPITYPPLSEIHYQTQLTDYLHGLVRDQAPDHVSDKVKDIIGLHVDSNNAILMQSNYEAYQMLMMSASEIDEGIAEVIEKAKRSSATPEELLYLNLVTDLPSVELKKLTHPFGHRKEYLKPMDTDVANAIHELGGLIVDQDDDEVKVIPHYFDTDAFIITTRQLFGTLEDLKIRKRKTYAIDINAPMFDENIRKRIGEVNLNIPHNVWLDKVLKESGLMECILGALKSPESTPYLYSLSTMIYSYHPDRRKPDTAEGQRRIQSQHTAHLAFKSIGLKSPIDS